MRNPTGDAEKFLSRFRLQSEVLSPEFIAELFEDFACQGHDASWRRRFHRMMNKIRSNFLRDFKALGMSPPIPEEGLFYGIFFSCVRELYPQTWKDFEEGVLKRVGR